MNPHPPLPEQGRGEATFRDLGRRDRNQDEPFSRISKTQKIRDCNHVAALLRERVLRLAFDCKMPRDAEFT